MRRGKEYRDSLRGGRRDWVLDGMCVVADPCSVRPPL